MGSLLNGVLVNVVANLVAAALVYLLAVVAGALPRNIHLIGVSTSVIGSVAGIASPFLRQSA